MSVSYNRRGQNFATHTSFVSLSLIHFRRCYTYTVLEFLGANIVDETPFIVMPFLRNGNAWCFILANPDCDRIKIV